MEMELNIPLDQSLDLPPHVSPRKSKRRSSTRNSSVNNNDENSAPPVPDVKPAPTPKRPSTNRFGFKKRSAAIVAVSSAGAAQSPAPVPVADVDLLRVVDECLGNLDAAALLLKAKTGPGGKLDFHQSKSKVL